VTPNVEPTHVVLVGMMGVGKTTTGMALAARLAWPVRDGDVDLEVRTGRTGAEIAAEDGLPRLHELEEEVLADALSAPAPLIVVAAASVVASPRARELLAATTVVWLDAPVDELLTRMGSGTHRRPVDRPATRDLLADRRAALEELADLHLDAQAPTDELVDRIVATLTTEDPPHRVGG
jgi:shikimate kinase